MSESLDSHGTLSTISKFSIQKNSLKIFLPRFYETELYICTKYITRSQEHVWIMMYVWQPWNIH